MISTTAIDQLTQLGRQRGGLAIDDIRQALPIDTMTTEEIAHVIARLEESGIAVEIDYDLLRQRGRTMPRDTKPPTKPSPDTRRPTAANDRVLARLSSGNAATEGTGRGHRERLIPSKTSGTIYVVAATMILFLLALGIWFCRTQHEIILLHCRAMRSLSIGIAS